MTHNLERELKTLWQKSHPTMSQDEIDIYFDEMFDAANTVSIVEDGHILAAGQWQEHKMTFVGTPINVGLISGLTVDPQLKPADRDARLAEVLRQLHQRQHERGIMYSIVIPNFLPSIGGAGGSHRRQWLEAQGYMTTSHQLAAETKVPADFQPDPRILVAEAEEWGRELWIFYAQHGGLHDFELRLSESDFFAMIARHDLRGGHVLVARRHGKIVGLALALREGKPLKNGKRSEKQFRMNFRYVLAADPNVLYTMVQHALALAPDCKQFVMTGGCPAKGFKGAEPHAMMRVIDAQKFLRFVAERLPGLQLSVGINSDADLPVNNAGYRLRDGRLYVSDDLGSSIVPPGGIPAMLLSGQPVQVPMG